MAGDKSTINVEGRFFVMSHFFMDKKGKPQPKKCKCYVMGYDQSGNAFHLGNRKFDLSEFMNQTDVPVKAFLTDAAIEQSYIRFSLSVSHSSKVDQNMMFTHNNDHIGRRATDKTPPKYDGSINQSTVSSSGHRSMSTYQQNSMMRHEQDHQARQEQDQTLKIETKFVTFMSDFWDEYDTDRDGYLNKDEFKRFLVEVYFEGEMDSDDEPLNAEKAKIRLSESMDKTKSFGSKFEEVFNEFDLNGDGLIDKEEMFTFLA